MSETIRRALKLRKRGKIQYSVRPNGEVVMRRVAQTEDPVLAQLLGFLASDVASHPEHLQPIDVRLVRRVRALVKNVNMDLDAPLSADDE